MERFLRGTWLRQFAILDRYSPPCGAQSIRTQHDGVAPTMLKVLQGRGSSLACNVNFSGPRHIQGC